MHYFIKLWKSLMPVWTMRVFDHFHKLIVGDVARKIIFIVLNKSFELVKRDKKDTV